MTSIPVAGTATKPKAEVSPEAISKARAAWVLGITFIVGLAIYYFVGVDEGLTSLFGKTMVIHEFVHDSRHFLGFPCH